MFSLDKRVAVVSGASRGIGRSIALGFSDFGARVYGFGRTRLGDSNVGNGEGSQGYSYRSLDLKNQLDLSSFFSEIGELHGKIDILVNAAGITLPNTTFISPTETFLETFNVNLLSAFECCGLVFPYMINSDQGSIINISSIGASLGFPGNPGYVASKGGLSALTRALAVDYGRYGIRVNNLVPGYIRTDMTNKSYENPEEFSRRKDRTILGRWGTVDDLVGPAIFLASSQSSYVTGTDIVVDGGWMAKGL